MADETKVPIEQPKLTKVEVGSNGLYRVGFPVEIQLFFEAEQYNEWLIRIQTTDADGNAISEATRSYFTGNSPYPRSTITVQASRKPLTLKIGLIHVSQQKKAAFQEAHAADPSANYYLELLKTPPMFEWNWSESGKLGIPSSKPVWLEIGASTGLKNIIASHLKDEVQAPVVATIRSFNELPSDGRVYEMADAIVINSDVEFPHAGKNTFAFSSETQEIANWVKSGGNLLLILHAKKKEIYHEVRQVWQPLLPGTLTEKTESHQRVSVWENFLGAEEPLVINEELRRNPPLIPVLSDLQGKVLLSDGDTPLVIEHQLGLGRVVTCLVDLNAEPWKDWKKRDELLQRLIPWHIPTDAEAKFASSSSSLRLGYDDLAGQFVAALGTFESVRLTPFWILMSAALGFGTLWYVLQSVLLKNWSASSRLILAALVVVGAILAFVTLTGGFTSESRLLANSAQVVDYNAMQGEYQGQCWLSLLSSHPRQADLQTASSLAGIENAPPPTKWTHQLEWLGMPGKGWGGLDAPLATWTQASEPYRIDSHGDKVQSLTLSPDLTKSFHGRWRLPVKEQQTTPLVSYHGESLPRGTLKSELPFALHDAILLYDTWGVELGTVLPGQVIDLDQIRGRVASAGTVITGTRPQATARAQSYDRSNTDVPQILKLLLLHNAAGGTRYTGLFSRAWPLLDQSGSLTANQALILGTGPTPLNWSVGPPGEKPAPLVPAKEVCWYRLWLPVKSSNQADDSITDPTVIRLPVE